MPKLHKSKPKVTLKKLAIVTLALIIPLFFKSKTVLANTEIELLTNTWNFQSNNGASENYQQLGNQVLSGKDVLRLEFDLHGTCLVGGDASAIVFDQPLYRDWRYVSLSSYAQNCHEGSQAVDIPLSHFPHLDVNRAAGPFHVRFWHPDKLSIEIFSAKLLNTNDNQNQNPSEDNNSEHYPNYKGEYWNLNLGESFQIPNRPSNLVRNDDKINFEWNQHSPSDQINVDRYIVRWTNSQYFDTGTYRFRTESDDGVRLYVNDKLIIDQWNDHPKRTDIIDVFFSHSGDQKIILEYYENTGHAIMNFNYERITGQPSSAPTVTPTFPPDLVKSWDIQSVSSMKETKDRICGKPDRAYIEKWVDKAKELGVTHIAVETPYDSPTCGEVISYTNTWIDVIRSRGLKVWHRHMFLAFEGIYDTPKNSSVDYLSKIRGYINDNRHMFREGDIFTPAPEPQNGGIGNFTHCEQNICMFKNIAHFNQWLRDAIDVSNNAFQDIGLGGQIKTGLYGFDGFIAWGSMNPDWNGILEDETIRKMGNIAIDHYPELVGDTMENALNELQARYPGVPIIISEWGSTGSQDLTGQVRRSMGAAKRPGVVGFNYWHMGMGGNEALINSDFTNRSQFEEVKAFFHGQR